MPQLTKVEKIIKAQLPYTHCEVLDLTRIPGAVGPISWVRSSVRLICWVGVVSALPAPIAWSWYHSNCLLLAVEHLMLLLLEHGMVCRRMWHRHKHCPLFVKDWKRIFFANLILKLLLNLIILSRTHNGFEIALT